MKHDPIRARHHRRGGAPVSVLTRLEPWEAELILNLRLWFSGPDGQALVWTSYRRALPGPVARAELQAFERLLRLVTDHAHRTLVRRDVACTCVGSDEAVFAHLVSVASAGDLTEASLIATLLVRAAHAEHAALLAGQVGSACRRMVARTAPPRHAGSTAVH
ncbi:MAG: hypothetical protein AAFQ51_14505 [Pseudomonadota bacterium]